MRVRLAVVLLAVACSEQRADAPVANSPLFDETLHIPSDDELAVEIVAAREKKRRADLDRALDAREPGEQLEHATLSQTALDRQVFTLADMFRVGDDLFAYTFRPENGLGNAIAGPGPNLTRVQRGTFGGPDALACADCHSQGGDDGAGTRSQNTFFRGDGDHIVGSDERNPPAVLGGGPLERLAAEMTAELVAQRASVVAAAQVAGAPMTVTLSAKGLAFGTLTASPDGTLDTTGVRHVSPDLIVRPFGWKGHQATLREISKEAFRVHLGVMAMVDQQAVRDGHVAAGTYGNGPWYDVDDDGATIEVEDGMLSTMVAYLAQLEVPVVVPPEDPVLLDRFARGATVFDRVECGTCHTRALRLDDARLVTRAEQSENAASPPVEIDVARDGLTPKIEPVDQVGSAFVVRLFSDLRRHDLGPALAAPADQPADGGSIAKAEWLTRPLWGLADTAPYLHDGRAPTLDDAIRHHGGEAASSRDAYIALPEPDRAALVVYLLSLQRARRVVAP
jgi:hypothetical protein